MKSNRNVWILVTMVVFTTIAVSFGTLDSRSQNASQCSVQPTPTPDSNFGDLSKYPTVDYNATESLTAPEREVRVIKNKRYDVVFPVLKNPPPEATGVGGSDVEPLSPAIPFAESRLIVIGEILSSKALLSNEKKGIYSEYSVALQTILKEDKQKKWAAGEIIAIDRAGGVILYPNGQKILYLLDWQDLPEVTGRYVFFLTNDDAKNPNYKILTAYRLENGKVVALDNHSNFREFNGRSETDFIKLILSKK